MHAPVTVRVQWATWKTTRPESWYSTLAVFPEEAESPRWSITLRFAETPADPSTIWDGSAEFLVEQAPWERLRSGAIFQMFEGNRVSATVHVA